MTITDEQVRTIVLDVTGLSADSDPDANLYLELGVPSATALNLLLELEETLGIKIQDEEFVEATSINKLISIVRAQAHKD